jgi:hypothetical protein
MELLPGAYSRGGKALEITNSELRLLPPSITV